MIRKKRKIDLFPFSFPFSCVSVSISNFQVDLSFFHCRLVNFFRFLLQICIIGGPLRPTTGYPRRDRGERYVWMTCSAYFEIQSIFLWKFRYVFFSVLPPNNIKLNIKLIIQWYVNIILMGGVKNGKECPFFHNTIKR